MTATAEFAKEVVTKALVRYLDVPGVAGEIALITDSPRTATVVTTSPGRLLVVTDRAFKSVLETMPSISLKLMHTLGERLHQTSL